MFELFVSVVFSGNLCLTAKKNDKKRRIVSSCFAQMIVLMTKKNSTSQGLDRPAFHGGASNRATCCWVSRSLRSINGSIEPRNSWNRSIVLDEVTSYQLSNFYVFPQLSTNHSPWGFDELRTVLDSDSNSVGSSGTSFSHQIFHQNQHCFAWSLVVSLIYPQKNHNYHL